MKKLTFLLLPFFIGLSLVQAQYSVGDPVEDFTLKNVNGEALSLADYEDAEGFLVIFTCNTCPIAKNYEQRILELDEKYADQGYPVIAINPNDPERQPGDAFPEMQTRAREKEFTFPYLVDNGSLVAKRFGAKVTPHTYLLQKNEEGQLIVRYIGAIDNNHKSTTPGDQKYVEAAVDALLAGEPVENTGEKAVGCSIKWPM
jgi:peroxiredoxin